MGDGTATGAGPAELHRDEVYDALRNLRRRYVLYYLASGGGPVPIDELAAQVAAWEQDLPVGETTQGQRKSVYSALHQTHLPKLEEVGLVSYDAGDMSVDLADGAEELDVYLATDVCEADSWAGRYVGLGAGSALLLLLVGLGVQPLAAVPVLGWTALVVAAFLVLALAHARHTRAWRRRFRRGRPDFVIEFGDG